jgi:hypothetical protein
MERKLLRAEATKTAAVRSVLNMGATDSIPEAPEEEEPQPSPAPHISINEEPQPRASASASASASSSAGSPARLAQRCSALLLGSLTKEHTSSNAKLRHLGFSSLVFRHRLVAHRCISLALHNLTRCVAGFGFRSMESFVSPQSVEGEEQHAKSKVTPLEN